MQKFYYYFLRELSDELRNVFSQCVAIATNLHIWTSNYPNMLFQHSEATFLLPRWPIWKEKLHTIIPKAKIGLEDKKTRETEEIL